MKTTAQTLLETSRALRKTQTPWEYKLWQDLRANRFYGIQFKRQVRKGNYIVDFCSESKKIIIELDGGYHNQTKFQQLDHEKEKYFESQGYKVIRFWNRELETNYKKVLERIREEVLFKR